MSRKNCEPTPTNEKSAAPPTPNQDGSGNGGASARDPFSGSLARIPNDLMVVSRDGAKHSWGSIKLLLLTLIVSTLGDGFCGIMMSVALPDISEAFHISLATANWVTVGYAIVAATAIMLAPALLAKWGLKKLFAFSRLVLLGSCVLGLLSANFPMLLGSRLIQAIASGVMFPTINTVIVRVVPEKASGQVVSLNSAIIGLGMAVAPMISGLFLTYVSLTSMYVVPLVISVVSLFMGFKFMFNVEPRQQGRIDVLSVILSFVGLAALMLGISEVTRRTLPACLLIAAGAAVIVWFCSRQLRIQEPLLNIRPLVKHTFVSMGALQYVVGCMGQQAILLLLPLFLERACDYSDAAAGALLIITTLLYAAGTLFAGRLVDRKGLWPEMSAGFLALAVGMLVLWFVAPMKSALLMAIVGGAAAAGFAFVNVPVKDVIMEILPDSDTADISAIFSTCTQVASSIGSALFVGILSADVLSATARRVARSAAYVSGFQQSMLIAILIEAAGFALSVWYSRQMIRHHMAKLR